MTAVEEWFYWRSKEHAPPSSDVCYDLSKDKTVFENCKEITTKDTEPNLANFTENFSISRFCDVCKIFFFLAELLVIKAHDDS